jgi:caffeoyl-CoA O-methyltransferase
MNLVDPRVEGYLGGFARHDDPVLEDMERLAEARRFPIVGPEVGRLLEVLARSCGAKRIVELGSGFGYSAYWFLKALGPGGHVTLTDASPERCNEARAFLGRGGFGGRFTVECGDALAIAVSIAPPVDLVFCDIDKHAYPSAPSAAHRLLRRGGLLVTDNMLWHGKVLEPAVDDDTAGVLGLTQALKTSKQFATAMIPLRDGLTVSVKVA